MPLTFNLTYAQNAMPTAQQITCVEYASDQWAATITDTITINVEVWAVDMTATGLNAICIPGIFQDANRTRTRPEAKLAGDIPANDVNLDLVVAMDTVTPWVLGTGAGVVVGANQYSLATTIMHELCHGLGFLGLCNVNTSVNPHTGTYTDKTLIPIINGTVAAMVPPVTIPNYFFPGNLSSGIYTAFGNLFAYTDAALTKGDPNDDYIAFTTGGNGNIQVTAGGNIRVVLSQNPFRPFKTCDHIIGYPYLMNPSTIGQYYQSPDTSSKQILAEIGWTIP